MPNSLLAVLQFLLAFTWVVYVIYLPGLAEQAGLERRHVPMILLMDQVIFLGCDWAAGVYADRVGRTFGRIGGTMAIAALVSCAAFIVLPWIAPMADKAVFLFLTILWSATSSALRAPTFALMSRHTDAAKQPGLACAYLFGLGVASAIAPYIAIDLRRIDPRIPFALSSIALAAAAVALAYAERTRTAPAPSAPIAASASGSRMALFAVALLLFALGFQVHFAINSAPSYLRFAEQGDLPRLMPIFWIGFNIAIFPAALLIKRFGGTGVMLAGGVLGVAALAGCVHAPSIALLIVAQTLAGAAWGIAMMSAFTAALEAGAPGREGFLTGVLFSVLAAAALVRLALIMSEVQSAASMGRYIESVPFIAWALAAFLVAAIAYPPKKATP